MFYHVTHTARLPRIRKVGLLPMQPSNWARGNTGKRYGNGEIYAFDNAFDAVRWAAKMDWDVNKGTGTGKISIIAFDQGEVAWEVDGADPLMHAGSKGRWLRSYHRVRPEQFIQIIPVTPELVREWLMPGGVSATGK